MAAQVALVATHRTAGAVAALAKQCLALLGFRLLASLIKSALEVPLLLLVWLAITAGLLYSGLFEHQAESADSQVRQVQLVGVAAATAVSLGLLFLAALVVLAPLGLAASIQRPPFRLDIQAEFQLLMRVAWVLLQPA